MRFTRRSKPRSTLPGRRTCRRIRSPQSSCQELRAEPSSAVCVPRDFVEAIHSLSYFVASAVADKDFSWIHVTPEKIGSPVVARLMDIVEADPAPSTVRYVWGWGGTVTVVTKSGPGIPARWMRRADQARAESIGRTSMRNSAR